MDDPGQAERVADLARALQRALTASGQGGLLASDWGERAGRAERSCGVWMPFYPFSQGIAARLFELRRARRLVRGLEGATEAMEREQRGLDQAAATRPGGEAARRISRLLVVANDGSPRFFRSVDRLRRHHGQRLELIGVEASATELGGAVYGPGRSARALLIDHKDAVVGLLEAIMAEIASASTD